MICQSFRTAAVPYAARGTLPRIPRDIIYGEYMEDIPAAYDERIRATTGLWETEADDRIHLSLITDQRPFPSYSFLRMTFNAVTGEFVERAEFDLGRYASGVIQDVYGGLWVKQEAIPSLTFAERLVGNTFARDTASRVFPTRFGLIAFSVFLFDTQRDYAMIGGDIYGRQRREVAVYRFSSGEFLYALAMPEDPIAITPSEGSQAYVLLRNKAIVGFDYLQRRVFQHTAVPMPGPIPTAQTGYDTHFAWSRKYRRFLICQFTPDNPDGSSTTRVLGYRNIPVATAVCKPIPLKPPRVGRDTPVLLKQIGDLGEGLAGQIFIAPADYQTPAITLRDSAPADGDGEAVVEIRGTAAGMGELDTSISVACTVADPRIANPLNPLNTAT